MRKNKKKKTQQNITENISGLKCTSYGNHKFGRARGPKVLGYTFSLQIKVIQPKQVTQSSVRVHWITNLAIEDMDFG